MTDKLPPIPPLPDKLPEPKELTDTDMAEIALENEDFTEAAQILDFLGYVEEAGRLCTARDELAAAVQCAYRALER